MESINIYGKYNLLTNPVEIARTKGRVLFAMF